MLYKQLVLTVVMTILISSLGGFFVGQTLVEPRTEFVTLPAITKTIEVPGPAQTKVVEVTKEVTVEIEVEKTIEVPIEVEVIKEVIVLGPTKTIVVTKTVTPPPPNSALIASYLEFSQERLVPGADYASIVGTIKNTGDFTLVFVQVYAVVWDKNGEFINASNTYTTPSKLEPGQTVAYSISLVFPHILAEQVGTWELSWEADIE